MRPTRKSVDVDENEEVEMSLLDEDERRAAQELDGGEPLGHVHKKETSLSASDKRAMALLIILCRFNLLLSYLACHSRVCVLFLRSHSRGSGE
jgi:hypothetical protein